MTGREIFLAQLRRLAAPRPAWVPFTGVHAAQLIGVDAQSYLQSAEHIVAGLCAARVAYRPDALPVVFDLQLEAEALGCPVAWAERAPPSVTGHPLSEPGAALPAFDLGAGRIPLVLEATRRMREQCTDQTGLFGLVCGPFTLAMHLMGTGMFLAMYDDPDRVQQVVVHAAAVAARTAEAYLAAGCDAIAVVDPMLSQIAPETAAEFARPHLETVYAEVHAAGAPVALFVCGDATANLDVLCAGACDALSVDENVDLAAAAAVCARHDTALGGNLGLTRPLLTGDPAACQRDALRCLDAGGDRGFILAPGCDLPYATQPANIAAVAAIVHDPYQRAAARAAAVPASVASVAIDLPDYAAAPAVVVDVLTLDSATCPPCRYMVDAVDAAIGVGGIPVQRHERKLVSPEGPGWMQALGVERVPSICIDGRPVFASRIPDRPTLVAALVEAARAKGLEALCAPECQNDA